MKSVSYDHPPKAASVDRKVLQTVDSGLKSEHLVIIGSVDTSDASGVAINGNTAYVADGSGGLQVIDISDPESPRITGFVDTPGDASGVGITGNTVYVADGSGGLQVIDVSDPESPRVIGSLDTPDDALDVSIIGDEAYIACKSEGLQMADVSDPENPVIIGSVDTPGEASGLVITGNTAYVADGDGGLQAIDVSSTSETSALTVSVDTQGYVSDMVVMGDTAYIASGGLQIIDMSNPENPAVIGFADTPGSAQGLAVTGDTAYVADGYGGLQVIDVSNPENPAVIGFADTPGSAQGIAVTGNTAYVLCSSDPQISLQVADVSDPKSPVIIGSVITPNLYSAHDLAVMGNTVYLASEFDGLQMIDVSDPENPFIIGYADTPAGATGVAVMGNTAYVANTFAGLQVIDVSNPESPVVIGSTDTPGAAYGVAVIGSTAYIADRSGGLQVIDVSNPESPVIIGSADTPGKAWRVVVTGNTAYVTNEDGGITVINPVPAVVSPDPGSFLVESETRISLTLPAETAGNYTLRVHNGEESHELRGAVTFLDQEDYQKEERKKALIVAGRLSPGDSLWDNTRMCTNYAYRALQAQGYDEDRIYYLSTDRRSDPDGDGLTDDVDDTASLETLEYAIRAWAAEDTDELLIYMTDHGGEGTFHLSENDILNAEDLDRWLDQLQESTSVRIILIYDACMSGSFIKPLTPPEGKERIIITSSSPDQYAYFNNGGRLSFSYQFWASVFLNANLYDAFASGRDAIGTQYQTPYLDGDGDGIGYISERKDVPKSDKLAAKDILIGRGWIAASPPPSVGFVSQEQTLDSETSATIQAGDITALNKIVRVWAVITPPNHRYGPGDPVTDLPEITLEDPDGDGIYEGTWKGFYREGTYRIAVYAATRDASGTGMLYSAASETSVIQTAGSPAPAGDLDGDGETGMKDLVTALQVLSGAPGVIWYDYASAGTDVNGDNRVGTEEVFFVFGEMAE
ncbi:C13 family peptidase [Desulfococcaceae bacterium HSG8]|nr:C13 family peptidase [Desulfococcaceae bacterium HSG8]